MSQNVSESVRSTLEQAFNTAWANRTPVCWENVAFDQPTNAAWVRFTVVEAAGNQVSLGPPGYRMERHDYVVIVQVFVPQNSGTKVLNGHCDRVAEIFRMATARDPANGTEIIFRTPTFGAVRTERVLAQRNVSIPFQLDALF